MSIEARVFFEGGDARGVTIVYFSCLLAGGSELRLCFFRDSRRLEFTFFRAWHSILTSGFPSSRTFKKEGQRTQASNTNENERYYYYIYKFYRCLEGVPQL